MVRTKLCEKEIMNCSEGNRCFYEEPIIETYKWPLRIEITKLKCVFHKRLIEGNDKNENLFTTEENKCRATDGFCQTMNGMIIWKPEEIIHDCPQNLTS